MSTLRIPPKIISMITRQMKANTNNHFKQVLRSLVNTFGNLYYVDGNGAKIKIKCSTGRMERNKGKDYQDNTLILPYISVFERGSSNADDRRRYTPVLVNEVEWDAKERRAKRYLSLSPRPVTIDYDINVWTKFVEDMDIIESTILSMFNPDLEIKTEDNDYIKAFLISEDDIDSEEQEDQSDRVIKKRFTISVETYIRSPRILYTNTSEIYDAKYDVTISGEGRSRGRGPRIVIPSAFYLDLNSVNLSLSSELDAISAQSTILELGDLNLSLSSYLQVSSDVVDNIYSLDLNYINLSLDSNLTVSADIRDSIVNLGYENLLLSDSMEFEGEFVFNIDLGYQNLILGSELSTGRGGDVYIDLTDEEDLNNNPPLPDTAFEDVAPLDILLSSFLDYSYIQDVYSLTLGYENLVLSEHIHERMGVFIDLVETYPSTPLLDFFELLLPDENLALTNLISVSADLTINLVELGVENLALSSDLSEQSVLFIDLEDPHPSAPVSDFYGFDLTDNNALDLIAPDSDFDP